MIRAGADAAQIIENIQAVNLNTYHTSDAPSREKLDLPVAVRYYKNSLFADVK